MVTKDYKKISQFGCIHILDWWLINSKKYPDHITLEYSVHTIESASLGSQIEVLEWWKNSGLELKYTDIPVYDIVLNNNITLFNWWINSGLPIKISPDTITYLERELQLITKFQATETSTEKIDYYKSRYETYTFYLSLCSHLLKINESSAKLS